MVGIPLAGALSASCCDDKTPAFFGGGTLNADSYKNKSKKESIKLR
jgi:hypothetical protein